MITLTATASEIAFISNIPSFVVFETDVPSTVYYTLDGSVPDVESLIAVGKVQMPTSSRAVTLRAIAISPGDVSEIITLNYNVNSLGLDGPRRVGAEGISILSAGSIALDSLALDADGSAAQESSIPFVELDMKASTVNAAGIRIKNGKTSIPFINFSESVIASDKFTSSTPNSNAEFDPRAKFIIINGSTQEKMDEQSVKIINRTYSTFGPVSKFYDEKIGEHEPIVTGNYVRSFYDSKKGLYVSYYWESLESRWIRSVQSIAGSTVNNGVGSKNKFVYRWIQDRSISGAF